MIGNDVYREEQWKSALRQFEKEPIIGTGTGTFADYSRMYRPWRTAGSEAIYAHNDLLQTAAETGWIGFGLLVLAVGTIAGASLRGLLERVRARREEALVQSNHCAVVVGGLASLAAFATHSVFDNNMHLAPNGLLGFVVLGLVASGAAPVRTIASATSRRVFHFVPAFALVLGASAFLLWSNPHFQNELLFLRMQNDYLRNQPAKAFALAERVTPDLPCASASLHLAAADVWQAASALPAAAADPELARSLLRRAEAQCEAALPYAPLDRYPHLRMAAVRSLLGEHPGAYRAAEQAILLDPQTAFAYEYMGGVLEAAGQLGIALRYYTLAIDLGGASAFPAARAKGIRQALQSSPASR
jgi:tetratricopeptide (TPR) repeat protein